MLIFAFVISFGVVLSLILVTTTIRGINNFIDAMQEEMNWVNDRLDFNSEARRAMLENIDLLSTLVNANKVPVKVEQKKGGKDSKKEVKVNVKK